MVAVDLGGTSIKAGLVDRRGTLLHRRRVPTAREDGDEAVLRQLVRVVTDMIDAATERDLVPLAAGVAVLGIVDERHGRVITASNLGWRDLPVGEYLEQRIAVPVALGHDVRVGAWAEWALGAGRDVADVLFLAVGTGVSAGLVLDGRLHSGGGYAGELGHVVVAPGGRACGCGNRGCVETVASAAAIADRYAELSGESISTAEVAARAARGGRLAAQVWGEAVEALATALAAAVNLLAPEVIIVGGGLGGAGSAVLDPLRDRLSEHLTFQRRPRVVAPELGDLAGCIGAGLLAWQRLDRQVRP
ncbi:ROK family protein [Haloechinothrix aidingensis]|uniref:ROK family protein n=1 Tax=Haloechinothrix aidingensis TaxID=2752311 RepID=UPI0031B57DEE